MKRLLRLLVTLLLTAIATAQTAVVTRNVNLRPDASTDNDPIEKLLPGAQLTVLEPDPTDGFFHVRAPDGQEGFVWGRNIRIQGSPEPTPPPTPSPSPSPTGTPTPSPTPADLFSQLMAAKKAAVGQPLVINGQELCGAGG